MTVRPTKKWIDGLRWIKAHEPVGQFGVDAPSMIIVHRLHAANLIEVTGREPEMWGFSLYSLTPAGRETLRIA